MTETQDLVTRLRSAADNARENVRLRRERDQLRSENAEFISAIAREAELCQALRASLLVCTKALKAYTPGDYGPGQQIIRKAMQLLGESRSDRAEI